MITLDSVAIPDFGIPVARPEIPAATYSKRCNEVYAAAGKDWILVYADREHMANMAHLTGFEPRFEEAVLLMGPGQQRILVVGNECQSYAVISPLPGLEIQLCQSFSLMGQDRTQSPKLSEILKGCGLRRGDSIGIVGWKYSDVEEWSFKHQAFFVPHAIIATLSDVVGDFAALADVTHVLMHPETGTRTIVDCDQIAAFEWASARASASVWRVVRETKVGMSELEAAGNFGYAGEPLSCHSMLSSASAPNPVIGLSSPSGRYICENDGITTAVGYWGGLSSRAGILSDDNSEFVSIAAKYFAGLLAWYETADIGVPGAKIFEAVVGKLAEGGLTSALSPGHLVSYDEWSHTPVRPGSTDKVQSGMLFQVDIIPSPIKAGWALNCEDGVAFADKTLREQLQARHPKMWARVLARRAFMRDKLGVDVKETILPLSSFPLCLPPLWLASNRILING